MTLNSHFTLNSVFVKFRLKNCFFTYAHSAMLEVVVMFICLSFIWGQMNECRSLYKASEFCMTVFAVFWAWCLFNTSNQDCGLWSVRYLAYWATGLWLVFLVWYQLIYRNHILFSALAHRTALPYIRSVRLLNTNTGWRKNVPNIRMRYAAELLTNF